MGYPEQRLRNPADGRLTYSSYADSAALAGALAFDYEQTGVEPMLIGHSQGGMLAIRVLYEFAGDFHDVLPVVDPGSGTALPRTTIVDPRTRQSRPVVGMHVAYAAALATGWLPRVLLGQWSMLPRLRRIPDTVTEFTGFDIPNDPIAGNLLGITPYETVGSATVRNVLLPASYGHVDLPRAADLPGDARARAWIEAWQPGTALPPDAAELRNIVHAADIWHSVKRHWCDQAQRLLKGSSS
jgi:pimeloyl-ACP methyl ester carboxylesterase